MQKIVRRLTLFGVRYLNELSCLKCSQKLRGFPGDKKKESFDSRISQKNGSSEKAKSIHDLRIANLNPGFIF